MYDAPLTVPAVLLALVLLVSGIAKLVDLETSAQAFTSLRLPRALVRLKAPQLLPIGEIALAVLLLVAGGPFAVVVAAAAVALFIAYLVVILRALSFDEPVVCSCFGKLGLGSVDRFTAVRNLVLVALAGLTLYDATRGHSVVSRMGDFNAGQWAWLAGVLAAVALTWLISGHRGDDAAATTGSVPAVDEDGDYLRAPIPFVEVRTPQDTPLTLRDMAHTEAVLLLIVSPTCGSCTDVIAYARTWQHTVPSLRTCLVLPMAPTENVPMLDAPGDFDILFDSTYAVARTFGVGNPSAVLLGADGKLAGGPVTGTKDVTAFMDDIADELREAGLLEEVGAVGGSGYGDRTSEDGAPRDVVRGDVVRGDGLPGVNTQPTEDAPSVVVASQAVAEATQVPADLAAATTTSVPATTQAAASEHPASPDVTAQGMGQADAEELLDYLPVPTPFAMFEDAAGTSTSLRQIGAAGPAVLLYVSPGCGSCLSAMDQATAWQERLGDVPIYYVVTTEPQARAVVERGIPENRVLVDEMMALTQMMGIGTPSMFAVGPAQELLAGPVRGFDDIAEAMEEIIHEVDLARPESLDGMRDGETSADAPRGAAADGALPSGAEEAVGSVPDVMLEDVHGAPVSARETLAGGRTLVVFLSPGCEACHDVAARVDAWREQLTDWRVRVMVPSSTSDFAADLYAPGLRPDLFDASLAFGAALEIETPAIVTIENGNLTREPARSQAECYALIRSLRGAAQP